MRTNDENFYSISWISTEIQHTSKEYSKKCIIGVPVYKEIPNEKEKSSFSQLCKIIQDSYEICLICPQNMSIFEYVKIAKNFKIQLSILYCNPEYFKSTATYSYLCETTEFYKCFLSYNYLFIYQLDGWIFKNLLDYYINLNVDYIGSPWQVGSYNLEQDTIGNGGVSLRKIEKFIQICESLEPKDFNNQYVDKEDLFFCKGIIKKSKLKLPSIKIASNFSLSGSWEYFIAKYNNQHLPMCIHGWYGARDYKLFRKYMDATYIQKETKKESKTEFDIDNEYNESSYSDMILEYYGVINKNNVEQIEQKNDQHINILIVHYNTPYLTECLIKSINKFVGYNCTIYIFDNSDKMSFTYKQENIKIIDNTNGQIIDFDKELSKYPNKGGEATNTFASFKHCISVDTCFNLINDNFILLDSDILLKKDIRDLYIDDSNIFCGDIETNICNIKRLIPFCCFINVKKCKELNIHYFYENLMHGLNCKNEGHKYDTGAAFYSYTCQYKHKLAKINDYIVHYKGASWDPNYVNNIKYHKDLTTEQWLEKNKQYWKIKKVIYTCITGNYEKIVDPTYVQNDFDYVCFTDNMNQTSKVWKFKPIPAELLNLTKVKQQRIIKICPHLYLPEYDESIWVDGSIDILDNMDDFIQEHCNIQNKSVFIRKHPQRDCIYDEGNKCIRIHKDKFEIINQQLEKYKNENYPENNGLVETNIIYRKHNDEYCKQLMELWKKELLNGSHRDQLSFNYCLWKIGIKGFQYLDPSLLNSKYFKWYLHHDRK